jgi:hypothetical protein
VVRSVVVVWIFVVLELAGSLVCGHDRLTKSLTFSRAVIHDGR